MRVRARDRELLALLDLHGRRPFADVAKRIGVTNQAVHNRMRVLEEAGVVSGYTALLDVTALGFTPYCVYVELASTAKRYLNRSIAVLKSRPAVYWVASLGGPFDLLFSIQALSVSDFYRELQAIDHELAGLLRNATIATRIEVQNYPRSYLDRRRSRRSPPKFSAMRERVTIEEFDAAILKLLVAEARLPASEMALRLGSTRQTVARRVRALERSGIVLGYKTLIRTQLLGRSTFIVLISVLSLTPQTVASVEAFCRTNPEIVYFVHAVGPWNFEITCEVADQADLQDLLSQLRGELAGVLTDLRILVVFEHYLKYQYQPNVVSPIPGSARS